MGPEFFQTRMGAQFFQGTLPSLVRSIDKLTEKLDAANQLAAAGPARRQDQSGQTDLSNFVDPYVTLEIPDSNLKVQVKLESEGIVVDVWADDKDVIATTWKLYDEMANPEIKTEEKDGE